MYKIIEESKEIFPAELEKAKKENWLECSNIFICVIDNKTMYCIMLKKEKK